MAATKTMASSMRPAAVVKIAVAGASSTVRRPGLAPPVQRKTQAANPQQTAKSAGPTPKPLPAVVPRSDLPPLRRWARLSALQVALLVSISLHAALLMLRIVDPQRFDRMFNDTPLDVILVNARGSEPPSQAQALAQASLAGGGDAKAGRATSPLPFSEQTAMGDASEDAHRRADTVAVSPALQLLAQVQRELALLPAPDLRTDQGSTQQRDTEERRRQLLKQLAEIERRINEDNASPKKRYVSPATREVVYAQYYDHLRRRIEERGTRDFPAQQGRKMYGELTMNITVDARGRLLDTEVLAGSGQASLDRQAVAIVRAAAPFGAFTTGMRRQADQIVVTSRFRFTRDEGVAATVGGVGD